MPESVANSWPDDLDALKGRVLLAAGDREAAKLWLGRYRDRLDRMEPTAEVEAAIRETDGMLDGCATDG